MTKQLYVPLTIAIALHFGVLMLPVEGESNLDTAVEEETETTRTVSEPPTPAIQSLAQQQQTTPTQKKDTQKTAKAKPKTPPKKTQEKPKTKSKTPTQNRQSGSPSTPKPKKNFTPNRPANAGKNPVTPVKDKEPEANTDQPSTNQTAPTLDNSEKDPSPAVLGGVGTVSSTSNTEAEKLQLPLKNEELSKRIGEIISPIYSTIQYPLNSLRNPYSAFPLYHHLDADKANLSKTLLGSKGLLKPEVEHQVTVYNITQTIESVVDYYREIFKSDQKLVSPFEIASRSTLSGDGYGVYEITLKAPSEEQKIPQNKGKAEPYYLHLVEHEGRTISLLLPQAFTKEQLKAITSFPRPEKIQLDRIIADLEEAAILDPVELNELQNADLYQDAEQYTLHGQTSNLRQLEVELDQQFLDSLFLTEAMRSDQTELRSRDPSAIVYTLTSGAEFTQYWLLVPTKAGGVALVAYRPLQPEDSAPNDASDPEDLEPAEQEAA